MDSGVVVAQRVPWRARRVSPQAFKMVALAAVWAVALTIISGAAVRLTGSGLGCPDWPACTHSSVVAPLQLHAWVEFGNRLINAFVSVASICALVAALRRSPVRRELTVLSGGLVAGLVAEIVIGALVVYFKLAPGLVMLHFLIGLVVLGDAVVLHHRAGRPEPDERLSVKGVNLVGPIPLALSRLTLATLAVVVTLGSIVTSTGPHGGDPKARRFDFSLHSVAELHGSSVEVFLAVVVVLLWTLARTDAPPAVLRRAQILLGALVAQAAVGYIQYFNADPVGLVALHVAGASLVVIAALQFHLGLRSYPVRVAPAEAPSPSSPTTLPVAPLAGPN